MYIHVGDNVILKTEEIIGFLDVETLKQSRSNLRILNMLKNQNPEILRDYHENTDSEWFDM